MADEQSGRDETWADALSKWSEAAQLNMSANKLFAAGAVALGAAATAYFWDPRRRDSFLENSRRFYGDLLPSIFGGSSRADPEAR